MLETKIAVKAFSKLDQFLDGSLDKELKSAMIVPAIISGICQLLFAFADVDIDEDAGALWFMIVVAAIPLWWTYIKIAQVSTVPFKDNLWKNIGIGVATNLIVYFALKIVVRILDSIGIVKLLGVGIFSFLWVFANIVICDLVYIKIQKIIYGEKVKTDVDFRNGLAAMKTGSGFSKETSEAINKIGRFVELPEELVASTNQSQMAAEREPVTDNSIVTGQDSNNPQINSPANKAPETTTIVSKLRELKTCLDEGLITQEEYESKKSEILHS